MKMRMRDGSGTAELRFTSEEYDRHGNVRVYFRRNGKRIRLRAPAGTDAFMAEYRAALAGTPPAAKPECPVPAAPNSFRFLCERYYVSAEFKRLGPSTRYARRRILDGLCTKHGSKPFARMEARHVRELRDERADRRRPPMRA